jgi:hypothetical protein
LSIIEGNPDHKTVKLEITPETSIHI